MMMNLTISHLIEMRLPAMAAELRRQDELPAMASLSFDERFSMAVEAEWRRKHNARLERMLKAANLRCPAACLEDIDFNDARKLDPAFIARLSDMAWLAEGRNLFITGACGVGKTWIASAFGNAACRLGKRVLTHRMPRLLDELRAARANGTWAKLLDSLKKPDLLILDDFGLDRLDSVHCRDLYEIVEDRQGAGSILITAQLPVAQWHSTFEDATVADAALDRIVHNAYRIELHGPSRRIADGIRAKGGGSIV
ncbi:MAG: IS21-like element helper ATPase IstB [Clostridia bacterium]|nr:IS21-like element helper ATPase IstB [Clostridia bacterium]